MPVPVHVVPKNSLDVIKTLAAETRRPAAFCRFLTVWNSSIGHCVLSERLLSFKAFVSRCFFKMRLMFDGWWPICIAICQSDIPAFFMRIICHLSAVEIVEDPFASLVYLEMLCAMNLISSWESIFIGVWVLEVDVHCSIHVPYMSMLSDGDRWRKWKSNHFYLTTTSWTK